MNWRKIRAEGPNQSVGCIELHDLSAFRQIERAKF